MKILTLKEFTKLSNEYFFERKKNKVWKPKTYKEYKSKVVRQKVVEYSNDEFGRVYTTVIDPGEKTKILDTNGITKIVVDFMTVVYGCEASRRISSEGRFRPQKGHPAGGIFIKGLNNGLEDVQSIYKGRLVAIELKVSKGDRLGEKQIERMNDVVASGGIYIAYKWVSFEHFQQLIFNKLEKL
jgi:hypothetical protein